MKNIIFIFTLFILFSCSEKKTTMQLTQLNHTPIYIEDLLIGSATAMAYTNSRLVILDPKMDAFFHLIDPENRIYMGNYGKKGQGPGEFIRPDNYLHVIKKNSLCSYDPNKALLSELKIETTGISFTPLLDLKGVTSFCILPTSDEKYFVGFGLYHENIFKIFNENGEIVKGYCSFPSRDEDEEKISNPTKAMAYQGKIALKDTNLVYVTAYADMINLYKIKDGDIFPTYYQWNSFPTFNSENGNVISANIDHSYPICFTDLKATTDIIYASFSGKSFKEHKLKCFESQYIYLYNWEGEKLGGFELDIPITCFCVDEENRKIYAIANNPNPELVVFNLPEIPQKTDVLNISK